MSSVSAATVANYMLGDSFYQAIINVLVVQRGCSESPISVATDVAQSVVNENPTIDDMSVLADLGVRQVFQYLGYNPA